MGHFRLALVYAHKSWFLKTTKTLPFCPTLNWKQTRSPTSFNQKKGREVGEYHDENTGKNNNARAYWKSNAWKKGLAGQSLPAAQSKFMADTQVYTHIKVLNEEVNSKEPMAAKCCWERITHQPNISELTTTEDSLLVHGLHHATRTKHLRGSALQNLGYR